MDCPKCGGEAWNNAQKNQQRVGEGKKPLPLFACKDKDGCGWVKWPPRGQNGGGGNAGKSAGQGNGAGSVRSTRPLGPLYFQCVKIAAATLKQHVPNATPADIVAAAATVFIGATNTGAPLVETPKPKPEPVQNDGGEMGGEGYGF